MRYLIISDLHLGNVEDNSSYHEKQLIEWIGKIRPDVLIMNGDIYDLWKYKFVDIKNYYKDLLFVLHSYNNIKLIGNSDYELFGRTKIVIEMKNGKKVCVIHSFQNDLFMSTWYFRFLIWWMTRLERLVPNSNVFSRFFTRIDKNIENNALELAKKLLNNYDFVVLGHTHNPGIFENGKYYNSGTCSSGNKNGIIIDTDNNTISLLIDNSNILGS
jgi:predicted phosphodiesterase